MQDFRKLRVWQRAQDLAVEVRRATHRFRKAGYGALKSQMVRAAESVIHNIVEGCGAATSREFGRFLDIAIKSASELESQLELARNYGILRKHEWEELTTSVVSLRRMLCTLRRRVLEPDRRPADPPAHPKPDEPAAQDLAAAGPTEGSPRSAS